MVDESQIRQILEGSPLAVRVRQLQAAGAIATALPDSPVEGEDVYYLADAAAGVCWHLKYWPDPGSAYDWLFVGGASLSSEKDAALVFGSSASWQDSVVGERVSVTLPLAGDYEVRWGANMYNSTASGIAGVGITTIVGGVTTDPTGNANIDNPKVATQRSGDGSTDWGSRSRERKFAAVAAATELRMRYFADNPSASIGGRWMAVVPVRVG